MLGNSLKRVRLVNIYCVGALCLSLKKPHIMNSVDISCVFIEHLPWSRHCVECRGFTAEPESQLLLQRVHVTPHATTRWRQNGQPKGRHKTAEPGSAQFSSTGCFHLLPHTFLPPCLHPALHPGGWSLLATRWTSSPSGFMLCWESPGRGLKRGRQGGQNIYPQLLSWEVAAG